MATGPGIGRLRPCNYVWVSTVLQDGLYDLSYRSGDGVAQPTGYGLASLRNGRILGSDRWGGVFSGSYRFDAKRGVGEIQVRLNAPPDGVLITGLPSGPEGLAFDLVAELNRDTSGSSAIVDVGGVQWLWNSAISDRSAAPEARPISHSFRIFMSASDKDTARRILLGRIAGAHGIKGAVLIKTFTSEPEGIADYGALEDSTGRRRFDIEVERVTPKGVIGRVNGIADRTQAEALKGIDLYVQRDRLPAPDEGEFYYEDLKGLVAVDAEGRAIGTVSAVVNYGAGDILEIRASQNGSTKLVPFTEACIGEVDVAAGRIVVTLPEEVDAGDAQGGGSEDEA